MCVRRTVNTDITIQLTIYHHLLQTNQIAHDYSTLTVMAPTAGVSMPPSSYVIIAYKISVLGRVMILDTRVTDANY